MRFSKLYAPSLKEPPKDAVLPSHILLLRAGFIQQCGSGLYNFLPLGKMVFDKIYEVIKDEMNAAGALQTSLSFVTPATLWRESGRYNAYGKELLRFRDRKDNEFVLGATHEEAMLNAVAGKITSYKHLPLHLYQIGLKFRDEARPRFGLLRCREFVMKDGYSFHADESDLQREFELMFGTYSKIFTRLGLNFRAVEADSGAIGGSGSKEFMVLAQNGEDDIVICEDCDYAANAEVARRAKRTSVSERPQANMQSKFHTPNVKTIRDLAEFFKVDEFYTIKAVVKKAIYEKGEKIVVFFVRGCDELQETKALNACGALEIADATQAELDEVGLKAGFIGFIGLEGVEFFVDNELRGEKNMLLGANEQDYHFIGVSVVNLNENRYKDLVAVRENDCCACCGGRLRFSKGIEVGHIFKLGQKYSKPLNATFLDENGKAQHFFMGCYGIGVSRLVAVAVESSFDEKGIVWSKALSPFALDIIISNTKDAAACEFAGQIYAALKAKNVAVLLDDRDERFGVKINDFELMGFCYALIIGKGLEKGEVELVERKSLEKRALAASEALAELERVLL